MPSHSRPEDRVPVLMLHAVNTLFTRIYHNLTILTPSHLPRHGAAILVCNHISPLDPLMIQSVCRSRLITWMMAKEYMDLPAMGRIFRTLGVIPVDRGKRETGALRQVFRQLEQGRIIGIFPEGRISTTGHLLEFQTGAALIAIRTGLPVFPVFIDGTQRNKEMAQAFLQPARSVITFGPTLSFAGLGNSKASIEQATARIKNGILNLEIQVDTFRNVR